MVLTSVWSRSLSVVRSRESTSDVDAQVNVVIYDAASLGTTHATERTADPADFVPESSSALVTVLEGMNTPVTVHEVVDRLVRPTRPPVETWGDVHERLYQEQLPALDSEGAIEFDGERGIVELPDGSRTGPSSLAPAVLIASISTVLLGTALLAGSAWIGLAIASCLLVVAAALDRY